MMLVVKILVLCLARVAGALELGSAEHMLEAIVALKEKEIEEYHQTHDVYPKLTQIPGHRVDACFEDDFGSTEIQLFNRSVHHLFMEIIVRTLNYSEH